MNTRKVGSSIAAFALAILGLAMFAQQGRTHEGEHMDNEAMQACAKACSDCQRACDGCATHCASLLAGGKKEHLKSLRSCQDCATTCAAAAQIVARSGPSSALICDACAKVCAQCAKECEKFPDDKHMAACAKECRKCEKACKAMVTEHDHDHAK